MCCDAADNKVMRVSHVASQHNCWSCVASELTCSYHGWQRVAQSVLNGPWIYFEDNHACTLDNRFILVYFLSDSVICAQYLDTRNAIVT